MSAPTALSSTTTTSVTTAFTTTARRLADPSQGWTRGSQSARDLADLEAAMSRHPAGRHRAFAWHARRGPGVAADGPRPASRVMGMACGRAAKRGLRPRLILLAVATIALLSLNWWLSSAAGAASAHPDRPEQVRVVQPGETLWAIALQVAPREDPRATILVIREANGMPEAGLQAGQRLVIPAGLG